MEIQKGLKYTKSHEWVRIEGNKAYIGIDDYSQGHLGEIVFVELPEVDEEISAGDSYGVVESVKAVSDVYCPVTGTIVEANEELLDNSALVNTNPYDSWFIAVEMKAIAELDELMDDVEYAKYLESLDEEA